jgi:hypothetical protein
MDMNYQLQALDALSLGKEVPVQMHMRRGEPQTLDVMAKIKGPTENRIPAIQLVTSHYSKITWLLTITLLNKQYVTFKLKTFRKVKENSIQKTSHA